MNSLDRCLSLLATLAPQVELITPCYLVAVLFMRHKWSSHSSAAGGAYRNMGLGHAKSLSFLLFWALFGGIFQNEQSQVFLFSESRRRWDKDGKTRPDAFYNRRGCIVTTGIWLTNTDCKTGSAESGILGTI